MSIRSVIAAVIEYRKSLNRSPPQIDAGLKLTPGVKLRLKLTPGRGSHVCRTTPKHMAMAARRSYDVAFKLKAVAAAETSSKRVASHQFKVDGKRVQIGGVGWGVQIVL